MESHLKTKNTYVLIGFELTNLKMIKKLHIISGKKWSEGNYSLKPNFKTKNTYTHIDFGSTKLNMAKNGCNASKTNWSG